jgi:hypothetical protein
VQQASRCLLHLIAAPRLLYISLASRTGLSYSANQSLSPLGLLCSGMLVSCTADAWRMSITMFEAVDVAAERTGHQG